MSPAPKRGTPAADATLEIRALARRGGGDVQSLQTLHVLECLLARISASVYRDDFVLKGGVLLAAYALRRPTKDIDVNATRLDADVESVATRVRSICEIDLRDGVVFDVSSIVAIPIRDDDQYGGVRVRVSASFGTARIKIGVDVSFGDPIWPAPVTVEVPRVVDLGLGPLRLLGYPLTMVLAEKIVTAVSRGEANTRWRDFADVCTIARTHRIDGDTLGSCIAEVAQYRRSRCDRSVSCLTRCRSSARTDGHLGVSDSGASTFQSSSQGRSPKCPHSQIQ